jgi:hypothetical protein
MKPNFDCMNLFCRVNVQSELPHQDFVATVARCAGGTSRMNTVRSPTLDISVFENDEFDPEMSRTGQDRWLYFRYTLEVDPVEGVSPSEYVASVGTFLESLWSSCMEAVAACDFEDHLPRNVRRSKWATA